MAINLPEQDRITIEIADGVNPQFSFDFYLAQEIDLQVLRNGVLQTRGTHYLIDGGSVGNVSGGTITFQNTYEPDSNDIITMKGETVLEREAIFSIGAEVSSDGYETDATRNMTIMQELRRDIQRTPRFPDTIELTDDLILPEPDDGKALLWDGNDGAFRNSTFDVDSIAGSADAAAASAAAAAASSATASSAASSASASSVSAAASAAQASNATAKYKTVDDYGADPTGVANSDAAFTTNFPTALKSVHVPNSLYKLTVTTALSGTFERSPYARFNDSTINESFAVNHGDTLNFLATAYKDRSDRYKGKQNPSIVCYGDSNTRYYTGDAGSDGPYAYSYGEMLNFMAGQYPWLYGATVTVKGFSGQTAGYGDTNFATNVPNGTDFVVIGFGTNNVKLGSPNVDTYLTSMKNMISKALSQGTMPIVLGIPWYYAAYGTDGVTSQERLRTWNSLLEQLCANAGVPFIDTYNMFKDDIASYFNESSNKRHYSYYATQAIARCLVEILAKHIPLSGGFPSRAGYYNDTLNLADMKEVRSHSSGVTFQNYTLGRPFNTVKIPAGGSLTMRVGGAVCFGFYPRTNATVDFTTANGATYTGSVSYTNATDGSLFYPVVRWTTPVGGITPGIHAAQYDITITATSGDAYLIYASAEFMPYVTQNQGADMEVITNATIPSNPVYGRWYFNSDLTKPMYYMPTAVWVGTEGYQVVGTTAQRTNATFQGFLANGYKFYDTTDGLKYRWNGTTWTAF